jgi:hypothetical protein
MSQAASASSLWISHGAGLARERLRRTVAELTRARQLQVLVDHGFGGLLAGLCLATVAVLVSRLVPLPYPPWQPAGAAVIIALGVALLIGWQRRPHPLEVAIRADLALRLKQRLSTAWEFMTIDGDGELAERLAAQAVKAGLPPRPGKVFPFRVNRWGRLAPVAAMALLLAGAVDLSWVQAPVPREVDEQVVSEGRRLGAFGREMQARAKRDELPRSERQAGELERLGARMESGALSRGEALGQLRGMAAALDEERKQALADAHRTSPGDPRAEGGESSRAAPGPDAREMLERMQRGPLDRADARALDERLADLERAGIPRRDLESALARHKAGADDALREILEKLAQVDLSRMEQKELQGAREQVRRARENLGESAAGTGGERDAGAVIDWDEEENRGAGSSANAGADRRLDGKTGHEAARSSQRDSTTGADRRPSPFAPESGSSGPLLMPESQVREGEVYTSQGRVLPGLARPSVENIELKREFASQVEEVLSREHYPAHYKEFIRRYFLALSRGANDAREQPPGTRGAP